MPSTYYKDFTKFAAIFFESLTTDDFRSVSPGARGKVSLIKHIGMKKATPLIGSIINLNDVRVQELKIFIEKQEKTMLGLIDNWKQKRSLLKETQVYDYNRLTDQIDRAIIKINNRKTKWAETIDSINKRKPRFRIDFEKVEY